MTRAIHPQISFTDLEFLYQGVQLDPILQTISDWLADHSDVLTRVCQDLERGLKNPGTGRSGLTPPQVLRSLVLMRVKNLNYRELRARIADGYTWRQFTEFYSQPVPQHHAFQRAFNRLTPETLQAVNEMVVQAAVDLECSHAGQLFCWALPRLLRRFTHQRDEAFHSSRHIGAQDCGHHFDRLEERSEFRR